MFEFGYGGPSAKWTNMNDHNISMAFFNKTYIKSNLPRHIQRKTSKYWKNSNKYFYTNGYHLDVEMLSGT